MIANCIIAIDDRRRFPEHLWRSISEHIRYGMKIEMRHNQLHVSPDGETAFVWLNPHQHDMATDLTSRIGQANARKWKIWLVVDYELKTDRTQESVAIIDKYKANRRVHVRVFSSYPTPPEIQKRKIQFFKKTPDDLRKFAGEIRMRDGMQNSGTANPRIQHVLITGAGFELSGGERYGLPGTAELLFQTLRAQGNEKADIDNSGPGYPIPRVHTDYNDEIQSAANPPDLDRYWNALLSSVYAHKKNDLRHGAASETQFRENMRASMLQYDEGHQYQGIVAASLRWSVWLTTNYTKFSDRAVNFADNRSLDWRVVSTTEEAHRAIADLTTEGIRDPYLFKLHGDIQHLDTMAVAGDDKEPVSRFFVRPNSHLMYASGFQMLRSILDTHQSASVRSGQRKCVYWHIVGHGLRDNALRNLIATAMQYAKTDQHCIVVNPNGVEIAEGSEVLV